MTQIILIIIGVIIIYCLILVKRKWFSLGVKLSRDWQERYDNSFYTGKNLNEKYKLGATHALYHKEGLWYHVLKDFPGILFDKYGFVRFGSEGEYLNSVHLKIVYETNSVHVLPPGISTIPGYELLPEGKQD